MKTPISLIIVLFFAPIFSCKKVINVNLNDANPQIVITGEITDSSGPYQVSITKTVNFSDPNYFPSVSGAIVTISDSLGLQDSLIETSPGIYSTQPLWQAHSLRTYALQVTSEGKAYAATSYMPGPVPLDSVGLNHSNRGKDNFIEAIPFFQDPPGIHNYYQFKEYINGVPLNKIFIFDDRLSDGRYIRQPLFDDSAHSRLQTGDTLVLAMYSIDSVSYDYLNTLMQISDNTGIQTVTPANPNTNLSAGALGYFSAHTTTSKEIVVH